jgi:hypothetical protein
MAQTRQQGPQDHTGRQGEQARTERDEQLERERGEREQRLSEEEKAALEEQQAIASAEGERQRAAYVTGRVTRTDEITVGAPTVVRYRDIEGDVPVVRPEDEDYVDIRVNTDLENMVYGRDNVFTFKRGSRYSVPVSLYNHLEEKGYIYH